MMQILHARHCTEANFGIFTLLNFDNVVTDFFAGALVLLNCTANFLTLHLTKR